MILSLKYPTENDRFGNMWLVLNTKLVDETYRHEWVIDLLAETGEVVSMIVPWLTKRQFESDYRIIYDPEE